ncbi:hypothetical protein C8R43DRAFT_1125608 [Mycena crocata]|nr:hypothetical protein C8R43DRAFT_1125608 [Mycena crocata]
MDGSAVFSSVSGRFIPTRSSVTLSERALLVLLPDELLLDIFGQIGHSDRLVVLRVCSDLHFLGARALYSDVNVRGLPARKLFALLAAKTALSSVYSTLLRRLKYTVTSTSEIHLTYPVLCQAMLTLDGLLAFSLELFGGPHTDAFLASFHRYGLIRSRFLLKGELTGRSELVQASWPTLPSLRGLRLRGPSALTGIVSYRELRELVICKRLDDEGFSDLCCALEKGVCGHKIETLVISVDHQLKTERVVRSLGYAVPNVEQLSLDHDNLEVTLALRLMVGSTASFLFLRRLFLNPVSSCRHLSDGLADVFCGELCTWLATTMDSRCRLVRLGLGGFVWTLDAITFTWTVFHRTGSVLIPSYLGVGAVM